MSAKFTCYLCEVSGNPVTFSKSSYYRHVDRVHLVGSVGFVCLIANCDSITDGQPHHAETREKARSHWNNHHAGPGSRMPTYLIARQEDLCDDKVAKLAKSTYERYMPPEVNEEVVGTRGVR